MTITIETSKGTNFGLPTYAEAAFGNDTFSQRVQHVTGADKTVGAHVLIANLGKAFNWADVKVIKTDTPIALGYTLNLMAQRKFVPLDFNPTIEVQKLYDNTTADEKPLKITTQSKPEVKPEVKVAPVAKPTPVDPKVEAAKKKAEAAKKKAEIAAKAKAAAIAKATAAKK